MQNYFSRRVVALILLFIGFGVVQSGHAQSAAEPPADPPTVLKVFKLKYARARDAGKLLVDVVGPDVGVLRCAVDERTNTLIVRSNEDSLAVIQEMISVIDRASDANHGGRRSMDVKSYHVHIDWLLSSDRGQAIPAKLKAVEEALSKHGVAGLRLAAATMASVQYGLNPEFNLSCSPLEEDVRLEIDGKFVPNEGGNPGLEIEIVATQQQEGIKTRGSGGTKQLAHVRTSVSAQVGHPVVLAVAPIDGVSSVFVVTIEDAAMIRKPPTNR